MPLAVRCAYGNTVTRPCCFREAELPRPVFVFWGVCPGRGRIAQTGGCRTVALPYSGQDRRRPDTVSRKRRSPRAKKKLIKRHPPTMTSPCPSTGEAPVERQQYAGRVQTEPDEAVAAIPRTNTSIKPMPCGNVVTVVYCDIHSLCCLNKYLV